MQYIEYAKTQLGCFIIILYLTFVYYRESRDFGKKPCVTVFSRLLFFGFVSVCFDGITAYTVNHLETVPPLLNSFFHMCFLISIDTVIFWQFIYMLRSTGVAFDSMKKRMLVYSPYVLNVIVVIWNMHSLEYRAGKVSNYSMGISAYTCFIMAAIYTLLSLVVLFRRWNYLEKHKRISIFTYLTVQVLVTSFQMIVPELLITSVGITIMLLGAYMNQENPAFAELSLYHREMVMGFSTLVESKDGSTGSHIRRTAAYVELLAEELRRRGCYKNVLTEDYIKNLLLAAPMHDIGKMSIPDYILQKPGKLTDEEFETIKEHTVNGGKIITETFGHLKDRGYERVAYEVARFHHEKWNGKGYPGGLAQQEIPLCARIMAIADVFDAVSQRRCYREAMSMDESFCIIEEGSGSDFEPLLTEVFLSIRRQVEEVYREVSN